MSQNDWLSLFMLGCVFLIMIVVLLAGACELLSRILKELKELNK